MASRSLSVNTTSIQTGQERFPTNAGIGPSVALGRNNLTAISHGSDLYFVAEFDQILVFQQNFPTQKLGRLIHKWRLPVSSPNLPGYIDRSRPHSVNALLIAWLGIYEVLVCACDDGDIIVYYVHEIQELLRATRASPHSAPKLMMIHNVGRSAWGLAVHTNSRQLAVSSNTHEVTIYSYALTDDSILYNSPDEWQYPGRGRDGLGSFIAHRHNIPSVAFYNQDKEGRWLVSTDLSGLIIVWDLRDRCEKTRIDPYESSVLLFPYSGWSVSCIDLQAFLLVKSDFDLIGCKIVQDTGCKTYDITAGRLILDGLVIDSRSTSLQPAIEGETQEENDTNDVVDDEEMEVDEQIHDTVEIVFEEEQMTTSLSEETGLDNDSMQGQRSFAMAPFEVDATSPSSRSSESSESTGEDDGERHANPSRRLMARLRASTKIVPSYGSATSDNTDTLDLPFILIHTSQDFVTMQKAPFKHLTIVARDPCFQDFAAGGSWLISHDRLHLTQVIPDLNVFIAATAAGRVAIYTLTRKIGTVRGSQIHDECGMRLEHVLPLQEQRAERSSYVLIGLAAAPLQSNHGDPSSSMTRSRWRLSLTYQDHTIINYELHRPTVSHPLESFI